MCDQIQEHLYTGQRRVHVTEAVGTMLAHDITEIRPGEFKGTAFPKGHIIRNEDVAHLRRLGKENLFVLEVADDEMHEDDAAWELARALMGPGVRVMEAPKEGKITLIAEYDGLLKINKEVLFAFNMLGEVMCATLHNNTIVTKGAKIAETRAIPLVVKKDIVERAVTIASACRQGVVEVKKMRKPRVGVVITGNEVYYGRVKDAFGPVIRKKIEAVDGEIVGVFYAPDDVAIIEERLRELVAAGADLLITTGGMSVDPDDVTRFAIRNLGSTDITYGSAMLPGAMFMVAYLPIAECRLRNAELERHQWARGKLQQEDAHDPIPILGIPACGMYAATTVFDCILPRVLCGEKIGRKELAELGHGGLCMKCDSCRYPKCAFGK